LAASEIVKDGPHGRAFLDTPGHEAFTSMRARGAKVTGHRSPRVAADDGVHAPDDRGDRPRQGSQGARSWFALNKIDKQDANPGPREDRAVGALASS
jgi:translation initiation factor IF-2